MRKALVSVGVGLCVLSTSLFAQSQESVLPKTFRDWWQTPEQQAKSAWNKGDNEALKAVAPNRDWQGAAAYRQRDFEAALEAYTTDGNESLGLDKLYNQATANIQLGDYANAIAQLEEVLAEQPENANAARNRDIAMRLLELEREEQQQGEEGEESQDGEEGEEGEDGEKGEESQEGEDGEKGEESQEGEDGEKGEAEQNESESQDSDSQQSGEPSGDEQSSEDQSEPDESSQEERDAEIEAAREALEAAGDQSEDELEQRQAEAVAAALSEEPMSEEEQATEQWLRQIPDDPDDLLRRKLLQNHRNEYPSVQRNGLGY